MIARLRSRPGAVALFGLAALTPLVVRDAYFLDSLVLILLWGALSAAWNVAQLPSLTGRFEKTFCRHGKRRSRKTARWE